MTLTANRSAVPRRAPTIYNPCMVKFDPQKHHRRSIRLKGFDYSQAGSYFVTIVTWHREILFGEVVNGEMNLLKNNGTVKKIWQRNYYEHIIRNDRDLQNKTDYIEANPLLWNENDENPFNPGNKPRIA